jgi:acyl-CoA thioesterase FadM
MEHDAFMIWFRMLWMMFTARLRRPIDIMSEHRLSFHCLPTDIDLNVHLTNSRFHTFMDQVRFDLILRSGVWRQLRAEGIGPVLGSSSIRFRKQVRPWQRFDVTARILSWDDRWMYMEHRVLVRGETAAIAIIKTAFVDKNGRIAPERFAAFMAKVGAKPPLNEVISAKNAVDKLLTA